MWAKRRPVDEKTAKSRTAKTPGVAFLYAHCCSNFLSLTLFIISIFYKKNLSWMQLAWNIILLCIFVDEKNIGKVDNDIFGDIFQLLCILYSKKSVVFLGRKVVVVTRDKLPILLLILYSWNLIRIIVIFRHWCCNELYTAVSHMQIHFKTSFKTFTRNLSEMITAQKINFRTGRK